MVINIHTSNCFRHITYTARDLYIRSLSELYKQSANDQLSFFQVAGMKHLGLQPFPRLTTHLSGIHGKPYIQWNGAGPQRASSNDWLGYCPHGVSPGSQMVIDSIDKVDRKTYSSHGIDHTYSLSR